MAEHAHTLGCGCTAAEAPGWAAIEVALRAAHDLEPTFYASTNLAEEMPLDAVCCFPVSEPEPHFHLVSLGLAELYEKTFGNPEVSGHGFEITLRVARSSDDTTPPPWSLQLLHNLAEYVQATRKPFRPGDHLNAGRPLAPGSALSALCFADDPRLGRIATPFGRLAFVQAIGLCSDELGALLDWDAPRLLALFRQGDELGLMRPERASLLAGAAVAAQVREGIARDGSSQTGSAVEELRWRESDGRLALSIRKTAVPSLRRALLLRLPFDREYLVVGRERRLLLAPAAADGWHADEGELTLMLAAGSARALGETIEPRPGRFRWGPIDVEVSD